MEKHILVLSTDNTICRGLQSLLNKERINTCFAKSVSEVESSASELCCDLIIIDMLKFETDLLRKIRKAKRGKPVPVLILHAKLTVEEKVMLYRVGASALLERTITLEICCAQVQALIRLHKEIQCESKPYPLIFGTELMIDPSCRLVKIDGRILELTRKEFDLLLFFAQNRGQVLGFEQLYEEIWNAEPDDSGIKTVKAHIFTLRKKLSYMGKAYLQNCWGLGYKFVLFQEKAAES